MELLGKVEVAGEMLEVRMPTVKDLLLNDMSLSQEKGIQFQVHIVAIATGKLIVEVEDWAMNDFIKVIDLLNKTMEIL